VPVQAGSRRWLALAAAAMLTAGAVLPAQSEPSWTFEQNGPTYVYTLRLTSELPADLILDVLFQPRHVAVFSQSAGRLVVLKDDGAVNDIRFDTRRLIFKCSSTFRRTLDRQARTIEIEMIGFKAGWGKLAPHARSSSARYTVTDYGTHREVVYRQEAETDRPVSGYSLRSLRKSMKEFARDLEQYLQRTDLVSGPDGGPGSAER
jgi:hypothetical protein